MKLLDRDREEGLRTTTRKLTFPDNTQRDVETWRVAWRWYDHLLAYEYCPGEKTILADAASHASETGMDLGDALASVVQTYVRFIEANGGDVTDDDLDALIAGKLMVRRNAQSISD
ncbi:hypothetical protein [Roseibium algae]|uniref:Uncharacterized protein n=1 Tax=Roseibium algae TaxID=3123038 RepID=A0ABU8TFD3_9HYPH